MEFSLEALLTLHDAVVPLVRNIYFLYFDGEYVFVIYNVVTWACYCCSFHKNMNSLPSCSNFI